MAAPSIQNNVLIQLAELRRLAEKFPEEAQKLFDQNPDLEKQIRWLQQNPIFAYQPFETDDGRLPDGNIKSSPVKFHKDKSKIRIIVTGNRCSKTYSAAAEVISACIGIDPITKKPLNKQGKRARFRPPIDVWVVSDTEEASIEIVQRTYHDLMPWEYLDKGASYTEERGWKGNFIKFKNGSTIRFKFSTQGRITFQGTYKHIIHLDEEPPEDIYKECLARTTPVGGRTRGEIVISFTPVYNPAVGISWIHKDLYAKRADIPQLSFHFWTLFDVPDHIIPDAEKEDLAASYDEDERDVRVLGMFTPVGMVLGFDRKIIGEQREGCAEFVEGILVREEREKQVPLSDVTFLPAKAKLPTTSKVESFLAFQEQEGSEFRVYRHPIEGHRYVLGADPAQGRTISKDSDEQAFYVIDRDAWPQEVVAEFTGNLDPHEYAQTIYEAGEYYNWAYVLVENNSDLTPIEYLRVNDYPNLHYQCIIEGRVYDKQTDKIGWYTGTVTRRKLRNDALKLFRAGQLQVRSERVITQMETFARGNKGRWEAIEGAHDDRIFALMIAVQGLEYAGLVDEWREEGLLEAGPEVDADKMYNAPRWSALQQEAEPTNLYDRFDKHMARKERGQGNRVLQGLVGE